MMTAKNKNTGGFSFKGNHTAVLRKKSFLVLQRIIIAEDMGKVP